MPKSRSPDGASTERASGPGFARTESHTEWETTVSAEIRQLVADCLAERPEAMGLLVSRFHGRVLRLCFHMLGQWQDAEDVAQETFLRVSRSLRSWDSRREFEPWLLAIAANRCRTFRARRNKQVIAQPLSNGDVDEAPSSHRLRAECLAEEVDRALQSLPSAWSEAFCLFHREGLDYQTVALQLGRPVGTVKTWVHRARLAILDQLQRRGALVE